MGAVIGTIISWLIIWVLVDWAIKLVGAAWKRLRKNETE